MMIGGYYSMRFFSTTTTTTNTCVFLFYLDSLTDIPDLLLLGTYPTPTLLSPKGTYGFTKVHRFTKVPRYSSIHPS